MVSISSTDLLIPYKVDTKKGVRKVLAFSALCEIRPSLQFLLSSIFQDHTSRVMAFC